MCSVELFKELSGGAQGPLRAAAASGLEAKTAPLALPHELLPGLPRQVCTAAQSGLEPG